MTTEEDLIRIVAERLTAAGVRLNARRALPVVIIALTAGSGGGVPLILIPVGSFIATAGNVRSVLAAWVATADIEIL